jgi:hypothetical protein
MNKIPTAVEFLHSFEEESDDLVFKAMIEFAKLHVQAALVSAWEKAKIKQEIFSETGEPIYEIDHLSILQSYPLNLIK